jgi:hypothetical protein
MRMLTCGIILSILAVGILAAMPNAAMASSPAQANQAYMDKWCPRTAQKFRSIFDNPPYGAHVPYGYPPTGTVDSFARFEVIAWALASCAIERAQNGGNSGGAGGSW